MRQIIRCGGFKNLFLETLIEGYTLPYTPSCQPQARETDHSPRSPIPKKGLMSMPP